MKLSVKDLMMMYQTTLRNVGLFTSISLALLVCSRYYRAKRNRLYNVAFILISMASLMVSITILRHMLSDHREMFQYLNDNEKGVLAKWYKIPEYTQYILYSIMAFSAFTLFREMSSYKPQTH